MALIKETELPLLSPIAELGRQMMATREDIDPSSEPAEVYANQFMEDMSEATYTEERPWGRRSTRALANIIRVNKDDLKAAKLLLEYERGDYHDFALAATIVQALAQCPQAKLAASLLKPTGSVRTKGPFYPNCKELNLKRDSNWSFHCLIVGDRSPELQESMKFLAGLFRVNARDLNAIARRLRSEDTSDADLEHKLSEVIIESVRTCPRFNLGLKWAQTSE